MKVKEMFVLKVLGKLEKKNKFIGDVLREIIHCKQACSFQSCRVSF